MLVGSLLFALGCLSGLFVGFLGAKTNRTLSALEDLASMPSTPLMADIAVDYPASTTLAKPFDLVVTLSDTGVTSHQLFTLDLNDAICDNFEVVSITPEPSETQREYGWHEYTYNTTLAPNSQLVFTLTLQPKHEGVFEGSVDAYFDDWDSLSAPVSIRVTPPN
ncbi:MAG: hypothetical protein R3B57_06935 [Phycisphaerales bacterium]